MSRRRKSVEGESFESRVARLADELKLAIEWNRPSILFAVYQSHFVMEDAQSALAAQVKAIGQNVERYLVTKENTDIPLILSHHPERERTVFFVQGIQFGGEAVVRALNMRREYFVEKSIRAVFWLTEYEATAVAHGAPDFWAFRHRSVDFMEVPEAEHLAGSNRDLAWASPDERTPLKDMDVKISLRQRLLADLPRTADTLGARAELQATLATLHSAKGDYESAIPYWQEAIENKELLGDARGLAIAYGGLANAYVGLGRFDEGEHVYRQAIAIGPRLAVNHNALGNLYLELGRDKEAITVFAKAVELDAKYAEPHHGLGSAYVRMGRYEEAGAEFHKAVEIDEKMTAAKNSLGYLYLRQGALDKAEEEFVAAMRSDDKDWRAPFYLGLVRLKQGRADEARAAISQAAGVSRGMSTGEALSRAVMHAAAGMTEQGLVEMRGLLARKNLPAGSLNVVLRDAEFLATAPRAPKEIADMIEMLRVRIKQITAPEGVKPA